MRRALLVLFFLAGKSLFAANLLEYGVWSLECGVSQSPNAALRTPYFFSPDSGNALISFDAETIDFGTVLKGSEQVRTFTFTNTGNVPLVITAIKGQCGCTTFPDWPKAPIPPGGQASFKVKFDTSARTGMFDKRIAVFCNAANGHNGFYEVFIKGNVVEQL